MTSQQICTPEEYTQQNENLRTPFPSDRPSPMFALALDGSFDIHFAAIHRNIPPNILTESLILFLDGFWSLHLQAQ
jgi:hypothetical protein